MLQWHGSGTDVQSSSWGSSTTDVDFCISNFAARFVGPWGPVPRSVRPGTSILQWTGLSGMVPFTSTHFAPITQQTKYPMKKSRRLSLFGNVTVWDVGAMFANLVSRKVGCGSDCERSHEVSCGHRLCLAIMLLVLEYWRPILFTLLALRGAFAFYWDLTKKMKTAANISTALSAPQTLLQEFWDECLANVSAENMEEARRVVEEFSVKVAPKSGKKFHVDPQCPAIRQAVRVHDLPLKRACATLARCTKCTGNIKQMIREDVIRRGFARVAVD